MSKSHYLPNDDNGKGAWLNNLALQLPVVLSQLGGITAQDVATVTADAAFFTYVLKTQEQVAAYARQWTAYKNAARSGGGGANLGALPVAPVVPTPPPAASAPDIFGRAAALVARIKVAPGFTEAIGQALKIIGADNPVDPSTLKPVLTVTLVAGAVNLGWLKQGMDGLEIWVDRGAGFVFLAIDTVPDYTDTAALPAAAAVWKYKGIYLQADERVGQWSDVVSLPVAA